MDLVIFEDNKSLVLEALGDGEFDYIEAASEVFEADFFRFIKARALLDQLAETYPMPRKKEEVPFWFYVASNLSCGFTGYTLLMRFSWWFVLEGCCRPLDRRRVARWFIRRRVRRRLPVRGLIRRITTTGRPLAIRIIDARSPRTPTPKPS